MNRYDAMYQQSVPPWEIGRPQGAIQRLVARVGLAGPVLDLGCGTGENAIWLAMQGYRVTGIDAASLAIARARAKADNRGVTLELKVADALDLATFGRVFGTIIDCGLFHSFSDEGQRAYRDSVAMAMRPGSVLHILCFSEHEPRWGGPRRVRETELREVFAAGWHVDRIVPEMYDHLVGAESARAWLATITRVGEPIGDES